jgi:hypothetical protein
MTGTVDEHRLGITKFPGHFLSARYALPSLWAPAPWLGHNQHAPPPAAAAAPR